MDFVQWCVDAELNARIAAAWGKFHKLWLLLRRRDTDPAKRMRLFESNVARLVLWCCESLSLTIKQKQRLQTTERAMLRRFAGPRRAPEEDYISWVRRATHSAEAVRDRAGIKSWVKSAAFQKWSWAGHVARMDVHRWAPRLMRWRDEVWWREQDHGTSASAARPMRARSGHFNRWEQGLSKYAKTIQQEDWKSFAGALSTEIWNSHGLHFSDFSCKCLRQGM